jgi:hypothetical protein
VSLPAWLCLLSRLETLRVDDNPFAPEWLLIVSPILATVRAPTPPAPSVSSSSSSVQALASPLPMEPVLRPMEPILRPIAEDGPQSAPLSSFNTPVSGISRIRRMRSAGMLNLRSINVAAAESGVLSPTCLSASSTPGLPSSHSTLLPPSASRFDGFGSAVGRRTSVAADEPPPSANPTKAGKWGFLRKMSIQKLRPDKTASLTASASSNINTMPALKHNDSDPGLSPPVRPGVHTTQSAMTLPTRSVVSETSEFGVGRVKSETMGGVPAPSSFWGHGTAKRGKRRSFLPIDPTPPSISISIPCTPLMPSAEDLVDILPTLHSESSIADETLTASSSPAEAIDSISDRYAQSLQQIQSYLRDLYDLSRPVIESQVELALDNITQPSTPSGPSVSDRRRQHSTPTSPIIDSTKEDFAAQAAEGKAYKDDPDKRVRVLREIFQ